MSDTKQKVSFARYRKDHYTDREVYDNIVLARSELLRECPFWGILSMNLIMVEAKDHFIIKTLATDGTHIYYNPDFIGILNRKELIFALAHEICHCIYNHVGKFSRLGSRDPKIWQHAIDYMVNDELKVCGIGEFITKINILHDEKFRKWSSDRIYEYLKDNQEDYGNSGPGHDQHLKITVVDDGETGVTITDEGIEVSVTEEELDKLGQKWMENSIQAAASQKDAEDKGMVSAGSIPYGVERMIGNLVKPKKNWKKSLRRYTRSIISRGYSYMIPNKPLFDQGFTVPGFRNKKDILDLTIMVDTSGSISQDELTVFVSEIQGIMKSFPNYNIKAWCFDGEVLEDSVIEITKRNGNFEDMRNFTKFTRKIKGGGGTVFMANWDYMKKNKIRPKIAIMFTDGCPWGSWGIPNYCPTIFLIVGQPHKKAPFGITMHYEDGS